MFTFKQRGVCLLCDLFHVFTLSRNNNVCNTMKIVSQIRHIVNVFKNVLKIATYTKAGKYDLF